MHKNNLSYFFVLLSSYIQLVDSDLKEKKFKKKRGQKHSVEAKMEKALETKLR